MKANELMVGDYVYNHSNLECPIVGIHKNSAVVIARHYGEEEFLVSDLRPIPLTTEILEKNGWVYIAEDKVFYSENLKGELPWIYYITDGSNEVFRMRDFCNLQYVHQLQHALRLCGIEKTIEL